MLDLVTLFSENEWKQVNLAVPIFNALLTFFGFLFVSLGWFVTGWLNRRLEVAKQRAGLRELALSSVIEVGKQITKNKIDGPSIEKAQLQLLIYGYPDEILLINKLMAICVEIDEEQPSEKQVKDLLNTNTKLMTLVRNKIRKQIGLKKLA